MSEDTNKKALDGIDQLVRSEEPEYLQYLIRNCDNIIKCYPDNPQWGYIPPILQLFKIRAEARQRLEEIYGIIFEESDE